MAGFRYWMLILSGSWSECIGGDFNLLKQRARGLIIVSKASIKR
jgi:hypothetical protein